MNFALFFTKVTKLVFFTFVPVLSFSIYETRDVVVLKSTILLPGRCCVFCECSQHSVPPVITMSQFGHAFLRFITLEVFKPARLVQLDCPTSVQLSLFIVIPAFLTKSLSLVSDGHGDFASYFPLQYSSLAVLPFQRCV